MQKKARTRLISLMLANDGQEDAGMEVVLDWDNLAGFVCTVYVDEDNEEQKRGSKIFFKRIAFDRYCPVSLVSQESPADIYFIAESKGYIESRRTSRD